MKDLWPFFYRYVFTFYNKQWLLSVQGVLGKSGFIVRLKHGYNFIPH